MKAAECLVQAGAWLQAIPSTENYSLKSPELKVASCLRMGLPLPFSDSVRKCDCGVRLNTFGYHLLTCKFGGGPV